MLANVWRKSLELSVVVNLCAYLGASNVSYQLWYHIENKAIVIFYRAYGSLLSVEIS
jgi:hypothetical protein